MISSALQFINAIINITTFGKVFSSKENFMVILENCENGVTVEVSNITGYIKFITLVSLIVSLSAL